MIGLLDPAFFLPRSDDEIDNDLRFIAKTCSSRGIELVPAEEYWPQLWAELGRPLETSAGPAAKRSIQEVRKLANKATPSSEFPARSGKAWRRGFRQLFAIDGLNPSWEERMASAVIRLVTSGHDVILFTRRVIGRNLVVHQTDHVVIEECTRWVLHVQPATIGHVRVICISNQRNLDERWTTRFDWRLPGPIGVAYPFCVPNDWWKASVAAVRTVQGKPAWIDAQGNAWTRPNIPGGRGYHWDVFIGPLQLQEQVGLSQLNVVEHGAPASEGAAGTIHHVPGNKAGRLNDTGWACTVGQGL